MNEIIEFPDRCLLEKETAPWIVRIEGDEPPSPQDIAALNAWMARSQMHRVVLIELVPCRNDLNLLAKPALPAIGMSVTGGGLKKGFMWLSLVSRAIGLRLIGRPGLAVAGALALVLGLGVTATLAAPNSATLGGPLLTRTTGPISASAAAPSTSAQFWPATSVQFAAAAYRKRVTVAPGTCYAGLM